MKILFILVSLMFSLGAQAHHTKGHMMLSQDPQQIVATMQQGNQGNMFLLLWILVFIFMVLGFIRWWKSRP